MKKVADNINPITHSDGLYVFSSTETFRSNQKCINVEFLKINLHNKMDMH